MSKVLHEVYRKQAEKTIEALRKNRFVAEYIETPERLIERLGEIIPAGSSCSLGGSETVRETGVKSWLEQREDIRYLDRYAEGANAKQIFHEALCCDIYVTGTNALTMQGELYNIDGRGNRLAAICYGPEKVVVLAGYNKLVPDLAAARVRMKTLAAPTNAARLKTKTPCVATGVCGDCSSPDRICSQELITGWQMIPERITVLILGGAYGY